MYLGIGFGALGLGTLGLFLPLLPTTVFVLLAAWAFARSSPRFHAWLLGHRTFGPPLHHWQAERGLTRRSKRLAVVSILISFSVSILLIREPLWLVGTLLVLMLTLVVYIWTRKEVAGRVAASRPRTDKQPG